MIFRTAEVRVFHIFLVCYKAEEANPLNVFGILNSTNGQLESVYQSFDVVSTHIYSNYLLMNQVANLYAGQVLWAVFRYTTNGVSNCTIPILQQMGSSFFSVYRVA